MHSSIQERITQMFLDSLSKGVVPWKKPWVSHSNFITKKPYRGINAVSLLVTEYECPFWLSFKQVKKLGGYVKEGSKPHPILYYKKVTKEVDGEEKEFSYLSYSNVFNLSQVTGIEWNSRLTTKEVLSCEEVIQNYSDCPEILIDKLHLPCYRPVVDKILIQPKFFYKEEAEYYSALFHEAIHSTGHPTRLNREQLIKGAYFHGSHEYSKEELVAEIGAAYLCSLVGIESRTLESSTAYVKGWLRALGDDPKMIVEASNKAFKAANYILGKKDTTES